MRPKEIKIFSDAFLLKRDFYDNNCVYLRKPLFVIVKV